ncbi:MAG TPA: LysR family transcriptional regulator [Burkholderiaceae bacterium]|jgi:DNA-binding transcriptional LysR family regulator
MHLDLKKLHHAVALAEERNFARAAAKVHLSQPALSRSIQALEAALDVRLFDRDLTQVAPTSVGLALIERARQLLLQASTLQREVGLLRSADLGNVVFGVGPIPAGVLLPKVLSELAREHPRVCVTVEVNNWQVLTEHLLNERIEFFVADARELASREQLQVTPIGTQPGGFYVRKGHPLAGSGKVSPKALAAYPMASMRLPQAVQRRLRDYLGESEAFPDLPTISCDKLEVINEIALNSDAIGINVYAAVEAEVKAGRLQPVRLQRPLAIASEFGVVSLAGRSFSPSAQWLIERMKRLSKQLSAQFIR